MDLCGRIAALQTSTSTAPSSARPRATSASHAAASATSASAVTTRAPAFRHSAATASSSSRLTRVFSTRSAPSAAKASAIARPMLRLAPVTSAVRPWSLAPFIAASAVSGGLEPGEDLVAEIPHLLLRSDERLEPHEVEARDPGAGQVDDPPRAVLRRAHQAEGVGQLGDDLVGHERR